MPVPLTIIRAEEKEYEIISKIKSPVAEALEKSLEKELRRKNFKVIK